MLPCFAPALTGKLIRVRMSSRRETTLAVESKNNLSTSLSTHAQVI